MLRCLSIVTLTLGLVGLAVACSRDATDVSRSEPDAASDARCAGFGCSIAACGQPCADPCGCCPNPSCSPDGSADGAGGGDGASAAGACGVTLAWSSDAAQCQSWADQACCAAEQECANDVACTNWVTCANACPVPRADACLAGCGAVPAAVTAFANCTKGAAPPPSPCRWPQ
jgi:hypothetical protein